MSLPARYPSGLRGVSRLKVYRVEPKYGFRFPVQADPVKPELFEENPLAEVLNVEIYEGRRRRKLGDLFKITEVGESEETVLELVGDFSKVRRVGKGMTRGVVRVKGDAGIGFGESMRGGKILIEGYGGSWLGVKMRGGFIEVHGDAGDFIGGAYRGETVGMRGGSIIVHGNVGWSLGFRMKDGLIIVEGNAGEFPGAHMTGGTLGIKGGCGMGVGAFMRSGKIVVLGYAPSIPPSFSFEEIRPRVRLGAERVKGPLYLFIGDLNEKGSGRLFIHAEANKHLSFYERFIEEFSEEL